MIDEAPTLAELYSAATESGNLRLDDVRRGDVDIIIAAGLTEGIGMRLLRLVQEYQGVDETMKVSVPTANPQTHRLLVLSEMSSLGATKQNLLDHAEELVEKDRYALEPDVVRQLVGRCIEVYLHDICDHCHGAKVTGLYGGWQPDCRPCHGTGKRRMSIGRSSVESSFARALLSFMDSQVEAARLGIQQNRRVVVDAKQWLTEQVKA